MPSWEQTELWQQLERRAPKSQVVAVLRLHLPGIETVLSKGGTAPLDFTLHDEDHAFRVAQRMVQVIPESVQPQLSIPELALLLLSAYLHDIGMTPERGQVAAHYHYLTLAAHGLTPQELEEFELWLAEQNRPVTPPMWTAAPTLDQMALAAELVTYYCRYKHNDWSKNWIEQNLPARPERSEPLFPGYPSWRDDLIDVCQSHHWDLERLLVDAIDPKLLPSGEVVHLRYLACILRVADVLENDPERTPPAILRHREIAQPSRIYWWRDQEMALSLKPDSPIAVYARPRSAVVHRAVLDTAAAIETELRLCHRLDAERPFRHLPAHSDLPHVWGLDHVVYTDVRPYKDSYVYIEGSFRPNTEKLLSLLAGAALYRNPLAAVRELLQNAFDAVREEIAYERLALRDSESAEDPKWELTIGERYLVELAFEPDPKEGNRWWLICSDDGSGMTKEIIENQLLVSGTVARSDIVALERSCKKKGFAVGRTAKFGIGVLSYFMIADRIEVTTQRREKGETLSFATEGIGSFGELRREPKARGHGTTVRLRLRGELSEEGARRWYAKCDQFLRELIGWVPCRLWVSSTTNLPNEVLKAGPGWFRTPEELREAWLKDIEPAEDNDLLTVLSWREKEGFLQDGLARYRLQVPVFRLPAGDALVYLALREIQGETDRFEVVPWPHGGGLTGRTAVRESFRGMCTKDLGEPLRELDWLSDSAGRLSVDRSSFEAHAEARNLFSQEVSEILQNIVAPAPLLDLIQASALGLQPSTSTLAWPVRDQASRKLLLRRVKFPAAYGGSFLLDPEGFTELESLVHLRPAENPFRPETFSPGEVFEWRGGEVDLVHPLGARDHGHRLFWPFPPDHVVYFARSDFFGVVPVWALPQEKRPEERLDLAYFPPRWSNLLCVNWDNGSLVNKEHRLVSQLSSSQFLEIFERWS